MTRWLTASLLAVVALCCDVPASAPLRAEQATPVPAPRITATAHVSTQPADPRGGADAAAQTRTRAAGRPWLRSDRDREGLTGFHAHQAHATTRVTDEEVRYTLASADRSGAAWVIHERFTGGRRAAVEPGARALARVSDFRGNDPAAWRPDQPTWSSVLRRDVYPGVDVEFRLGGDTVEKVFTVSPGADVRQIRVVVAGVNEVARLDNGELALRAEPGTIRLSAPIAWQGEGENRRDVSVRYTVSDLTYGFEVGAYDSTRPLVIDPVLYSTFVGGESSDRLDAIALGPDGNVYVVGQTLPYANTTVSYPATPGAYDRALNGAEDIVISKFTPDLSTLLASTYVGGNRIDAGRKIAFDASGNVFVAGETFSTNFPTLGASSWEATYSGGEYSGMEGFVIKMNASLTSLLASTYLGGYWWSHASALAVNLADGSVFVAGHDDTSDKASWTPPGRTLPSSGYLKNPITNSSYAYIARFNSTLSNMTALTFLYGPRTCTNEGGRDYCPQGGGGVYEIWDLGVANGSVYAIGKTGDWTFPTTAGAFDRSYSTGSTVALKSADPSDVIVLKFDLNLTTLQGSTFLGGKHEDYGKGLAFDARGNVFVTGTTNGGWASTAPNPEMFPVTTGAFDETHNGYWDAFVSRLDPSLTTLQASTFIGGSDGREEWANDIVVAPGATGVVGEGDVFIGGAAMGQIPTGVRAFQETAAWELFGSGGWYHTNPYIARLDWRLGRLLAATYLQSGGDGEEITGIAVTPTTPRSVFVTGYASRPDFPVSPGAYDTTYSPGSQDGFVSRLPATLAQPGILVNVRGPGNISPGERGTYTVNYANGLDMVATNVVITASVPAGMNLVDISGGGMFYPGGSGCGGEVMWRIASMNSLDAGTVTFTVEVPWGAADARVEITARGAAASETTPYFDVAPYLAFVPTPHPTSVELGASGVAAQLTAFPAARRLLDYARSIGYRFFETGSLDSLEDGTQMLRLYLFAPDGGLATLVASGDRTFVDRFFADSYMLMNADGGFTWDRATGTLTPFGGWATTAQPSGSLMLALADESDRATAAMAASGFAVSRCRFNCMINKIPEVALSKLSTVYKTVSAGKNCTVCALSIRSGTPNTEACTKCSAAMAKNVEAAKDLAPVIGDALKAYYIIGNCEEDCKDPTTHICNADKWECCTTILSWLGGFDATCRTACNRTTGTYAPVITDRVNCAYGQACTDGACGAKPRCTGVSCAQAQTRTRPARDPNAKAVAPGGNILPGDTLSYTIDFENVGAGTADGVFILDTLDAHLDATTLSLDAGCAYIAANRLITCTIGTLAAAGQAGAKGSVTFTVKPMPGLAMDTEIVNQAEVHFPSAFEITPTNAVVNRIHGLRADPLWLTTTVAAPVQAVLRGADASGKAVTFRITRGPLHGTLTGTGASLAYTPSPNFAGGDDFEYVAGNGTDESLPARVTIRVIPSAGADTTRPVVTSTSPSSGATGILATTLDVNSVKVYGPTVRATFSEPMDASTLTAATFTLSGISAQVAYDGVTRTASLLPSAALAPGTTYTATITSGVKDASGNTLATTYTWTFKTAAASEPNITLALPDAGTSPVAVGASLANRRKIVSVSNTGSGSLTISSTGVVAGDSYAFLVSADECKGKTLAPGTSCSLTITLATTAAPIKTSTLRITSNDPDTPVASVPLTTTTATAPAAYAYYLAEGATGALFDTRLAIANPGDTAATGLLTFLGNDGTVITHDFTVPALRRWTLNVRDVAGMENAEFSTTVESDRPLIVDRTLSWDRTTAYGAHAERAVSGPSLVWYLAEGATTGSLNLFYLLQNPNAQEAQVRVRYLRPSGGPIEKTYTLLPNARTNIWVDVEDFPGLGLALANTDVSAVFTVLNNQPIIVERALYAEVPGQFFGAGHESAGITAPALEWFLAEGMTGDYFDLFVLIANPSSTPAAIEATYLLPNGTSFVKPYTVGANSRFNIWVDYDDARLANTAVSTTIRSTNGVPVIVERALWWPGNFGQWYEAHNSPGATSTGTRWALAEGEVGGTRGVDTYILLANTSTTQGTVLVTLLFENQATVQKEFYVAPRSRFNVDVRSAFPAALGKRFGAIVESLGPAPAEIVVERAMYWNAAGQFWAAGTNALATRLQ